MTTAKTKHRRSTTKASGREPYFSCRDTQDKVVRYVLRDLPKRQQEAFERHLHECHECLRLVRLMTLVVEKLASGEPLD